MVVNGINKFGYIMAMSGVAWILNGILCFTFVPMSMKGALETRARENLRRNGLDGWNVQVEGMDAILLGPKLPSGEKTDPDEQPASEAALLHTGIRRIITVRYRQSAVVGNHGHRKPSYFTIAKLDDHVSLSGNFATVDSRDNAEQALIDLCGSLNVTGRASVDGDLNDVFDPEDVIRKLKWIQLLNNFTLTFDGSHVILRGDVSSPDQGRIITERTRQAFGSKITVQNEFKVVGGASQAQATPVTSKAKASPATPVSEVTAHEKPSSDKGDLLDTSLPFLKHGQTASP